MATHLETTSFFEEVFYGAQRLPLKGFALAAAFGLLTVVVDLLIPKPTGESPSEYVALAVVTITLLATFYRLAMMISDAPPSWVSGMRFVATLVVILVFAFVALLGGLLLERIESSVIVVVGGVALFLVLFGLPLLAGWPIAQAISNRFVSPLAILGATKGHRWGLITTSIASTAINKIFPATYPAKSGAQSFLLAIGDGAVSCVSLILFASIAATAYKFAVRADPTLAQPQHPHAGQSLIG